MGGWTLRRGDERRDRRIDGQAGGWMDGQRETDDEWMMDGQTDSQTNDGWMMNGWVGGRANG